MKEDNIKQQEKVEMILSRSIKESVLIGKTIKAGFLDSENNLQKNQDFNSSLKLLAEQTENVDKLKTKIIDVPTQKSAARIDKHLWNVHQFYIDLSERLINFSTKIKNQHLENSSHIEELEKVIKMLKEENKKILDAGREKIKDCEEMILKTRRIGNEEKLKFEAEIKNLEHKLFEAKENTYRKDILKKYLVGNNEIKEKLIRVLIKTFEYGEDDQKEILQTRQGNGWFESLGIF